MDRNFFWSPTTLGIVAALVVTIGVWVVFDRDQQNTYVESTLTNTQNTNDKISVTDGVERWYTNNERTYSFRIPDGFSAPDVETGTPDVTGMSLQKEGVDPFVILVYPVAPDTALTEESIRSSLEGVAITQLQTITLQSVVRGFLFRTNAAEWNGSGLEVWTINNGKLYRIMTSLKNEDLLTFILTNWYFSPPFPAKPK